MTKVEVFEFGTNEVRTVLVNEEPYFVGKDVAEILGYAKARNAISRHVDDEDKKDAPIKGTLGGTQQMTIINESGLYSLILSSKLPTARKFKRWVTSEVLPQMRKHGAYLTDDVAEKVMNDPDYLIALLERVKDEKDQRIKAQKEIEILQPKAAYCDLVLQSPKTVPVSAISKDYGMSAVTFNQLLHQLGVQYKQGKLWLLYAKYQNKNYTKTETFSIKNGDISIITKWTQSGRLFLYEFLKAHGVLPLMEQEEYSA